jgi:hypothetical protein
VYFLLTHPRARAMMAIQGGTLDAPALRFSLLAATLLAPLVLVGSTLSRPSAQRNLRALAYGLLVLVLHALIYLVAGRFEPVYAASTGPDTDFLLLSVMVTIFHNVQYVALVWSYNRRRHSETPVEERDLAAWLSRSIPRYLAACAAFSIVYFALASSTGVYPGLRIFEHRVLGDVSWNQVGLALWWGLALHHYVLDQCIWRVSKDARLRAELNVA